LRRLCGWERAAQVPGETVFSQAFAKFEHSEFPRRVHAALTERTQKERLVGHILRDATAIDCAHMRERNDRRVDSQEGLGARSKTVLRRHGGREWKQGDRKFHESQLYVDRPPRVFENVRWTTDP
jgi:hypothetical protein